MIRPWMVALALRLVEEAEERSEEERERERKALEELSDKDLVARSAGAPIRPDDFVEPLPSGWNAGGLTIQRDAGGETNAPANSTLFVASTNTPDRAMDVIEQDWTLREWRSNPVIFDNHNPLRVVGQGTGTVPKNGDDAGKLMIRVAWNTESPDPSIAAVGHDHLNGFRRAGSVGFVSKEKTPRDKLTTDHYAYQEPVEIETWWGGKVKMAGTYFRRNNLREFSSASIPANPDAIQRSLIGEYEGIDPLDVERRAGARFPRDLARALVDQLRTEEAAETRTALFGLLWPDVVQKLRSALTERDAEIRRVISALVASTPPAPAPVPVPSIAQLVLDGLKNHQES